MQPSGFLEGFVCSVAVHSTWNWLAALRQLRHLGQCYLCTDTRRVACLPAMPWKASLSGAGVDIVAHDGRILQAH
jgi:hypothetical protein